MRKLALVRSLQGQLALVSSSDMDREFFDLQDQLGFEFWNYTERLQGEDFNGGSSSQAFSPILNKMQRAYRVKDEVNGQYFRPIMQEASALREDPRRCLTEISNWSDFLLHPLTTKRRLPMRNHLSGRNKNFHH